MQTVHLDKSMAPFANKIGLQIEINPEAVQAHCVLDIKEFHHNRAGTLHGGIIATLLDSASGITASLSEDEKGQTQFLTVALNINYLTSISSGCVRATGKITGGGKSIKFVSCELKDEKNQLIATSTGVFKMAQLRQKR